MDTQIRSRSETRRESEWAHPEAELAGLRREIEEVDQRIVSLIALRCQLAHVAGTQKRAAGLPTIDPAQEARVVRRAAQLAREVELDEESVRQLFWCLIGLSRRAQENGSGERE